MSLVRLEGQERGRWNLGGILRVCICAECLFRNLRCCTELENMKSSALRSVSEVAVSSYIKILRASMEGGERLNFSSMASDEVSFEQVGDWL